ARLVTADAQPDQEGGEPASAHQQPGERHPEPRPAQPGHEGGEGHCRQEANHRKQNRDLRGRRSPPPVDEPPDRRDDACQGRGGNQQELAHAAVIPPRLHGTPAQPRISLSVRKRNLTEGPMRKFIFWATVAAGAVAAYMMYRRGEDITTIARESMQHPVKSLLRETKNATSEAA